jgi:hypothetical protein
MRIIIYYVVLFVSAFCLVSGLKAANYEVVPKMAHGGSTFAFQADFFDYKRQDQYFCNIHIYGTLDRLYNFFCARKPTWNPANTSHSSERADGRKPAPIEQGVDAYWHTDPDKGGLEFCINYQSRGGCFEPEWKEWGIEGRIPAPWTSNDETPTDTTLTPPVHTKMTLTPPPSTLTPPVHSMNLNPWSVNKTNTNSLTPPVHTKMTLTPPPSTLTPPAQ